MGLDRIAALCFRKIIIKIEIVVWLCGHARPLGCVVGGLIRFSRTTPSTKARIMLSFVAPRNIICPRRWISLLFVREAKLAHHLPEKRQTDPIHFIITMIILGMG